MDQSDSRCKYSYKSEQRVSSLFVQNVGHQRCPPNYGWGPGIRSHFLIHHVISGRGTYWTGNKTYRLSAGDTFIAYPGVTIAYCADQQEPWEYYWVGFNGSDARLLLEQTDFTPQNPVISTQFGGELQRLLGTIYDCRGSRPFEAARMTGNLYLFLSCLIEKAQRKRESAGTALRAHVERAAEYVADNFSHEITVEDMAKYAGISRSRLYRGFMEHLRLSPSQYLMRFRIDRARILLLNTALSVKEIAYSVGFADPLYFSRAFRRLAGASPLRYRREQGKT